jgi:hypothetical protein
LIMDTLILVNTGSRVRPHRNNSLRSSYWAPSLTLHSSGSGLSQLGVLRFDLLQCRASPLWDVAHSGSRRHGIPQTSVCSMMNEARLLIVLLSVALGNSCGKLDSDHGDTNSINRTAPVHEDRIGKLFAAVDQNTRNVSSAMNSLAPHRIWQESSVAPLLMNSKCSLARTSSGRRYDDLAR